MNNLHILQISTAYRDENIAKENTLGETATDKNMPKIEEMMHKNNYWIRTVDCASRLYAHARPLVYRQAYWGAFKLINRATVRMKCLHTIVFSRYTRLRKFAQQYKKTVLLARGTVR